MKIEHSKKIQWMHDYCSKNKLTLTLEGECGFGRECVGVLLDGSYPDYMWYDDDYNELSDSENIWIPEDAYHKHPCVAVLGRGVNAEDQLYNWLKWFDDNKYKPESGATGNACNSVIEIMMGKDTYKRMVAP